MDTLWPKSGDTLFVPGGFASLAGCVVSDLSLVAVGYKEAADSLVTHIAQNGRDDALIFPIVFCYRQSLELHIKQLILLVATFDETGDEFKRIHDLSRLWKSVKARLVSELEPQDVVALNAVEKCIEEFQAIDPQGYNFRYAEPLSSYQLDLGNLKVVMNRILAFLSSLADMWEAGCRNKL